MKKVRRSTANFVIVASCDYWRVVALLRELEEVPELLWLSSLVGMQDMQHCDGSHSWEEDISGCNTDDSVELE